MNTNIAKIILLKCKATIGRRYKAFITSAWQTGKYGCLSQWECELQQMRNSLGPAWLEKARV